MRSRRKPRAKKHAVRVGVAGWSIPSQYKDELPGDGSHLERYAQRLNSVEINSSFYRHHRVQTYTRWAASVPSHFRFSVKVPQALTHEGELHAEPDVLDQFIEEVGGLGPKLAVLLVQLPPSLEFDQASAKRFFKAVHRRIDVRVVCEPRHVSWSSQRADSLLADHSIARAAADPPLWPGGNEPGGCDDLVYFRWHGQPRKYYSDYGKNCLETLERQVSSSHARDVWAIFDNTAHGFALGNALAVAEALG
ncbi:MAG: DUF72 domain-containing protein [Steroidobacter sp.]